MSAEVSAGTPERGVPRRLRAAGVAALTVGAAGSVGLLLHAGRRQHPPRFLLVLFTLWVLSPFAILAWAHVVSMRWSALTRATLYGVILFVTLASLAIYGVAALGAARPSTAVFVATAPASWLLIAMVLAAAALISGRGLRRRR